MLSRAGSFMPFSVFPLIMAGSKYKIMLVSARCLLSTITGWHPVPQPSQQAGLLRCLPAARRDSCCLLANQIAYLEFPCGRLSCWGAHVQPRWIMRFLLSLFTNPSGFLEHTRWCDPTPVLCAKMHLPSPSL